MDVSDSSGNGHITKAVECDIVGIEATRPAGNRGVKVDRMLSCCLESGIYILRSSALLPRRYSFVVQSFAICFHFVLCGVNLRVVYKGKGIF